MCFSAAASFAVAVPLIAGGGYCLYESIKKNKKYWPMAVMPLAVGLQQLTEGFVWTAVNEGYDDRAYLIGLVYMFFVWMFWPFWVPYMTSAMEPEPAISNRQLHWAKLGLLLGSLIYLPFALIPEWVYPEALQGCLSYNTVIIFDFLVPRWVIALLYLCIIAVPPLLSSHFYIRRFGFMLLIFAPITYIFFEFAYLSVLCFFAAVVTADLIYIVINDKCRNDSTSHDVLQRGEYVPRQESS